MVALVRNYEGHDIYLDENYSFEVTFPGNNTETFSKMADAVSAIDKHNALIARQNRVKFSAVMIDENGKRVNVRGIDGRNASLLGVDSDRFSHVYPDVLWVTNSFRERSELYNRITAIEKEKDQAIEDLRTQVASINSDLEKIQVKVKWGYGRLDPEEYEKAVTKMETRYKTALMHAMEKQAIVEKTKTAILGRKDEDE